MPNRRGIILFIVLATVIIVSILAGVILTTISSQSRLSNHQVSRIKAYYAGKAAMNYTIERLRKVTWILPPATTPPTYYYACHKNCIDAGASSSTVHVGSADVTYNIIDPTDGTSNEDIPYNIQVKIYPDKTGPAPANTVAKLEIKTQYTYTP